MTQLEHKILVFLAVIGFLGFLEHTVELIARTPPQ